MAVALVMAYHLFAFPQGWMGVDIFFVLSGYLITTILLKEKSEPKFWQMFYTRRVARIFPAFFLLLLLVALTERLPLSIWLYLIFTGADVAAVLHNNIVIDASLGMLWSLAVEEHFYLVWPALVRRFSLKPLVVMLTVSLALEPIARSVATLRGWNRTTIYFLTPFRLDGLILGSLLAIALTNRNSRATINRALGYILPVSVVAFLLSFPFMLREGHEFFLSIMGYSLIAITSTTCLAYIVLRPKSGFSTLLSFRPLAWLGRISYGLYLYHFFIPHFLISYANRHGYFHNRRIMVLSLLISIPLSWLSFRFYERFFLDWGKRKVGNFREEQAVVSNSGTS